MTDDDRLLAEWEAAEYLGTSPGALSVARARRVGAYADIPYVRLGRAIRYRLTDLTGYIEERTVRPATK